MLFDEFATGNDDIFAVEIDLDDFKAQIGQMKKMGGMEGVMSMLPGVNKMKDRMDQVNIDERMLIENEAIILSMTKKEKENPKIISGSRRKRISNGAGAILLQATAGGIGIKYKDEV